MVQLLTGLISTVLFLALHAEPSQDYSITPIHSSSGLYYEKIGQVSLSNNNWEFITYIDYSGYLIFYQYLHEQAQKLEEFCAVSKSKECADKSAQLTASMNTIAETQDVIGNYLGLTTNKRQRRWVAELIPLAGYILEPLGRGIGKWFENRQPQNMEMYDKQIAELKNSQDDIKNYVENQMTIFKSDSDSKANKIDHLSTTVDKIKFKLTVVEETANQDSVEKERKIKDLQELLKQTRTELKSQQETAERHTNDIKIIEEKIFNMRDAIEEVASRVAENQERIDKLETRTKLNSIVADFMFLWTRFHFEQDKLLNVITNANKGFLDPYVISPTKLIELLREARNSLPDGSRFPFPPEYENAMKLYKIVDPIIYLYNYTIVFKLRMKLVNVKTYSLYKMTSAPVYVGSGKYVFVLPQKPYLLIDRHEEEYALVPDRRFRDSCKDIEDEDFLCSEILANPVVSPNSECEVQLFLNKFDPHKCDIRMVMSNQPILLQLIQPRSWIYAVHRRVAVTFANQHSRTAETLRGSGFLNVSNKVTAVMEGNVLTYVPDSKYPKVTARFSPRVNISDYVDVSVLKQVDKQKSSYHGKMVILPFESEELEALSVSLRDIPGAVTKVGGDNKDSKTESKVQIISLSIGTVCVTLLIGLVIYKLKYSRIYPTKEVEEKVGKP